MVGKGFLKLLIKITALFIPVFLIIPISMIVFPLRFYDGEYSWYEENKEYSISHDGFTRVLILGDSVAKAAYLPSKLSDDTYNFALGGLSPAEEYYYLRDYLKYNDAPEYVFYMISPFHFTNMETLWSRSVYFHRINMADLKDLIDVTYGFSDENLLYGENADVDGYYLFYLYSSNKYNTAFFNGLTSTERYTINTKKYHAVIENKGQTQFGTAEFCNEVNSCVALKEFVIPKTLDYYFRKTIELCTDYGIKFVYENAPMNEMSYNSLNENFLSEYIDYLNDIQESYPETIIEMYIPCYEDNCFGDSNHLNIVGTNKFSSEIREKYANIFEG